MHQAVLETERLVLRPRTVADFDACYAMNCEPGTLDFIDFPGVGFWDDAEAHKAFLSRTMTHSFAPGLGYWVVSERGAEDVFLGWVLMAHEGLDGPEIEIGWRLTRAARGRGFATEAARRLVDHGFEDLGLNGVVADMYRANHDSMSVARKLGMRPRPDPVRTTDAFVLWELPRALWAEQNRESHAV